MPDAPFHPITRYFDAREVAGLPREVTETLSTIQISFKEPDVTAFDAHVSWAGSWWFTILEGRSVIQTKVGFRAGSQPDYALVAIALSGRNRPQGKLDHWPRPGEMVLMPWVTPSNIISAGEFRYFIAHIPIGDLMAVANAPLPFGRHVSVYAGAGHALYAALRGIANESGREEARSSIKAILPEIARLILRVFALTEQVPMRGDRGQGRLAQVRNYLECNLSDPYISASQAAAACGLSKRQLFRLFEQGESFSEILRRMRIEKARDALVLHPELSVSEVARLVGLTSASHLSRAFRQQVGCSPRQFRKNELRRTGDGAVEPGR